MRWVGPADEPERYRIADDHPVRGMTWRAVRSSDGAVVALKQLRDVPPDWDRQRHVLLALGRAGVPGIAVPLDAFLGCAPRAADKPFHAEDFDIATVVTAWVPGADLDEAAPAAAPAVAIDWLQAIAASVQALHRARDPECFPDGLLHLDLRPSNVRVRPDSVPVILDHGRLHPRGEAWDGRPTGGGWCPFELGPRRPPGPAPAEIVGPATDGWGVAAIGYWLLTGDEPGTVPPHEARVRMAREAAGKRLPQPDRLAGLLAQMLAADPSQRPGLASWSGQLGRLREPRRRAAKAAAAVCGMALLVLIGSRAAGDRSEPGKGAQSAAATSRAAGTATTTTAAAATARAAAAGEDITTTVPTTPSATAPATAASARPGDAAPAPAAQGNVSSLGPRTESVAVPPSDSVTTTVETTVERVGPPPTVAAGPSQPAPCDGGIITSPTAAAVGPSVDVSARLNRGGSPGRCASAGIPAEVVVIDPFGHRHPWSLYCTFEVCVRTGVLVGINDEDAGKAFQLELTVGGVAVETITVVRL